jgi:hypothetical protein
MTRLTVWFATTVAFALIASTTHGRIEAPSGSVIAPPQMMADASVPPMPTTDFTLVSNDR